MSDTSAIGATIVEIVAYVPRLIGALFVLLVGWIVGKFLGRIVTRMLSRADLGRVTPGDRSASEEADQPGGDTAGRAPTDTAGIASAVGTLITYYVYYLAVVSAADILRIRIVTELLSDIGAYLPVLFGAALVLVVGVIVGRLLEDVIVDLLDGMGIDAELAGTPLEKLTGDRSFGWLIGRLVALYVYIVALLAAADALNIGVLSSMLSTITQYVPQLIGGAVVLLVGIWLGDWLGAVIASEASSFARAGSIAVKGFVYYLVVTIALQTAGFDAGILSTLLVIVTTAVAGALALSFIVAVGVGGALGSKEYIAENIDGWVESARQSVATE
ncbi:mechanosensitive ion channel family protein [Halocatena halophila]|uniref:mechanosensitive ion channel family protein n=1 Tax=Halocatena halophila TaxID=2814576 RepID=UPI002ED09508